MSKKYEIITSGKHKGRIRALRDFDYVRKGDIGGFIASEDNLSHEGGCWVFGDAKVYGDAMVFGNARIFGNAKVSGNARVYDDAWVSGDANIFGYAEVSGDTWVYGDAKVYGNTRVYGNAEVFGNTRVYGNPLVCGNAKVFGNARVYDDAEVAGNAQVCGDSEVYRDMKILSDLNSHPKDFNKELPEIKNSKDYQNFVRRTNKTDSQLNDLTHVICGLGAETGEVLALVQKGVRDGVSIDLEAMKSELGDVLWYTVAIMNHFGLDFDDVIGYNVKKLVERGNLDD